MCETAKKLAIRKSFLVCCEQDRRISNSSVAIRNAGAVSCDGWFASCKTPAKHARRHPIFDRLEKNKGCGFSGLRQSLIAVLSLRNCVFSESRFAARGLRRVRGVGRPDKLRDCEGDFIFWFPFEIKTEAR